MTELLVVVLALAVGLIAVGGLFLFGRMASDVTALMAYANEVDQDLTSVEDRLDELESPPSRARARALVQVEDDLDEHAAREARIAAHRAKKREMN